LYADREARQKIALAFNDAITSGEISQAVILSRDHHDVSGTDSPFRETSNVYDGSMFTADMAIHNVIGDAARGATWVSIHNGGGVGWGEVTNGGFGMVLDGSQAARDKAAAMLYWDVNNGVARRAWSRNENARLAIERDMALNPLVRTAWDGWRLMEIADSCMDGTAAGHLAGGGGRRGDPRRVPRLLSLKRWRWRKRRDGGGRFSLAWRVTYRRCDQYLDAVLHTTVLQYSIVRVAYSVK
jgi:hypothetical protein